MALDKGVCLLFVGVAIYSHRPMDLVGVKPFSVSGLRQDVDLSSCDDSKACRTTWDIVLICFATIFACSWIAIHPNISYPVNKQRMTAWKRYLYDLRIFLVDIVPLLILVLVFPEFMLAHAIRQRLVADSFAKRHGKLCH